MCDVPSHLECAYCIRNRKVGGECFADKKPIGCLAFKMNPMGCIKYKQTSLLVPLYHDVPLVGEWTEDWEVNGNITECKIEKIHGVKWDTKRGYLKLLVDIAYFENEFAEGYKAGNDKPKLKLIKKGGE